MQSPGLPATRSAWSKWSVPPSRQEEAPDPESGGGSALDGSGSFTNHTLCNTCCRKEFMRGCIDRTSNHAAEPATVRSGGRSPRAPWSRWLFQRPSAASTAPWLEIDVRPGDWRRNRVPNDRLISPHCGEVADATTATMGCYDAGSKAQALRRRTPDPAPRPHGEAWQITLHRTSLIWPVSDFDFRLSSADGDGHGPVAANERPRGREAGGQASAPNAILIENLCVRHLTLVYCMCEETGSV
jgi:hypothetical protein